MDEPSRETVGREIYKQNNSAHNIKYILRF
jgi:hypothetical protein